MSGLSLFSKGSGRQKVEKWRKIRSRRVATFLSRPACSPRSQVSDDKEKNWLLADRDTRGKFEGSSIEGGSVIAARPSYPPREEIYVENCRNTGASGALLIPEPITNIYPRYRKIKFILKRTIKNKEKDRCETEKYVIPFLHPLLSDNSNNIVMIFHLKGTHYRFDQISRRIPSSNHVSRNTRHYARSPLVFQYTPEYAKRACTLASVKLHGASNPQGAHEPVQCGEGSPRKPLLWNFERVAVPAQLA